MGRRMTIRILIATIEKGRETGPRVTIRIIIVIIGRGGGVVGRRVTIR